MSAYGHSSESTQSFGDQLTTHLLNLARVQLLTDPGVALYLLGIKLPLCQESNLSASCQQANRDI